MKIDKAHFRGCLVGGAAADARAYATREGGLNLISDNTQMASFTVDGLVWASNRAKRKGVYAYIPCLFYAYQKWYYTQTGNLADKNYAFILNAGDILDREELFARRGAGMTSMIALSGSINNKYGTLQNRINNSKGCGAVMRSAPIGLYFAGDERTAFRIACEAAALTHGHIDAILSAGVFAYIISAILRGAEIKEAAKAAFGELAAHAGHERCSAKLAEAVRAADEAGEAEAAMNDIGDGFTGECALALALYCALRFGGDAEAAEAVTSRYEGNRYSISSICGNILGAYGGCKSISYDRIGDLELTELLIVGADRLYAALQSEKKGNIR